MYGISVAIEQLDEAQLLKYEVNYQQNTTKLLKYPGGYNFHKLLDVVVKYIVG